MNFGQKTIVVDLGRFMGRHYSDIFCYDAPKPRKTPKTANRKWSKPETEMCPSEAAHRAEHFGISYVPLAHTVGEIYAKRYWLRTLTPAARHDSISLS